MKRFLFLMQIPLFAACNFFVFIAILEIAGSGNANKGYNAAEPVYNDKEEYDPSMQRLSSLKKLQSYCDSVFAVYSTTGQNIEFEKIYPAIVVSAVRKRFYHGYSSFGVSNNFAAWFFEPLTGTKASAIVLADDILKYPYAACSQQSIVVMELLRKKGFPTRSVSFTGKKFGHFSFEIFFNGSWHFFDPNMEPDEKVLAKYNYPGIAFLVDNKHVLLAAYKHLPVEKTLDIFPNYRYGKASEALAPWASFYQKTTRFLSYTLWAFFLFAFIWVRRKYKRLSHLSVVRPGKTAVMERVLGPSYYPGYSA